MHGESTFTNALSQDAPASLHTPSGEDSDQPHATMNVSPLGELPNRLAAFRDLLQSRWTLGLKMQTKKPLQRKMPKAAQRYRERFAGHSDAQEVMSQTLLFLSKVCIMKSVFI